MERPTFDVLAVSFVRGSTRLWPADCSVIHCLPGSGYLPDSSWLKSARNSTVLCTSCHEGSDHSHVVELACSGLSEEKESVSTILGRNRVWPNRFWPSVSDRLWPNRLWPNRLWPNRLWPNRLWPKPTLAKPTLAKPTLAKTDFGQNRLWPNRLWPKPTLAKVKVLVVCKDFGFWELIVQGFFLAFVFCLLGGWMLERLWPTLANPIFTNPFLTSPFGQPILANPFLANISG